MARPPTWRSCCFNKKGHAPSSTASISLGPGSRMAAPNSRMNASAVAVDHPVSARSRRPGAGPPHLDIEDAVTAVGQDDGGDVQPLARHGPERLRGVHGAAIGFQGHHLAAGAGQRGAQRHRQSLANCAAGHREMVVAGGAGQMRPDLLVRGNGLIGKDGALGRQRAAQGPTASAVSGSPTGRAGRGEPSTALPDGRAPNSSASHSSAPAPS